MSSSDDIADPGDLDATVIETVVDLFKDAWQAGTPPKIEEFLRVHAAGRREFLEELVQIEWEYRLKAGDAPNEDEYRSRFPDLFTSTDLSTKLTAVKQLYPHSGSALAHTRPTLTLRSGGAVGNYALFELLGQGAMGQVFRAQHRTMKRMVALKVIAPMADWADESLDRFRREIETVARLSHPNIVMAYDADEVAGVHYLAMELVDGVDLARLVRDGGPLPVNLAVDYVLQAVRGLDHAHREGIVHRDVKPSNLIVNAKGVIKVLDLGLARWKTRGGSATESLTQTGQVFGTADYMAPEQAVNAKSADARSDVYSLGCTLWFLLTGQFVYSGNSLMASVMAHRQRPIPSLHKVNASVTPALDAVFARMIAKEADSRYQTMDEVIVALESQLRDATPTNADKAKLDIAKTVARGVGGATAEIRPSATYASMGLRWAITVAGGAIVSAGLAVWWNAVHHGPAQTPSAPAASQSTGDEVEKTR